MTTAESIPAHTGAAPAVTVENLTVRFVTRDRTVHAVNGVSFELPQGEVLCIIGESGSGKSVTMRALMRLLPAGRTRMSGSITVAGQDVMAMGEGQLRRLRGRSVAMVFQEPMTALDPVFTLGTQIAEIITRHEGTSKAAARQRALELLEMVQIPSARRRLDSYPHELSGGLRQRAMIASALACRPALLLADEPTTALDATVQIQILLLLRSLQREMGMSVIFVTHDLGVANEIADSVAVMYGGRMVETGTAFDVMSDPRHPYTRGLLSATVHGGLRGQRLTTIPGAPPNLETLPTGCSFAPRCPLATARCTQLEPPVVDTGSGRMARCLLLDPAHAT